MDGTSLALILAVCVIAALLARILWKASRDEAARNWPSAEATIQSAEMEEIGTRYKVELPCFAFSYSVDGEYYSGRFSLSAKEERAAGLMKEMINRKLTIQYDPQKPSSFSIPAETIEDCEVGLVPD